MFAAAILLLCLTCADQARAHDPYRIGFSPDAAIHEEAKRRLEAVYDRAGLPVEFVPLPQKRSLVQAVDGVIDGDVGRIPGLNARFPTLVRVDVELMKLAGAAYVVRGQKIGEYRPELFDALRVGAVRGVLWAEKVVGRRHLDQVNNYETLFEMLLQGRIDIALGSRVSAESLFNTNPGRYARIRQLEPLVYQVPFFHYVNVKNRDIVPKLEKALRELRARNYWRDEDGD